MDSKRVFTDLVKQSSGYIDGRDTILIVNGEGVKTYIKNLPTMQRAKMQSVARFSIEDDTASSLDDLKVHAGKMKEGGSWVSAVTISREKEIIEALSCFKEPPLCIVPDYFLLPIEEKWVACVLDDRVLIRESDYKGCVLRKEHAISLFDNETIARNVGSVYVVEGAALPQGLKNCNTIAIASLDDLVVNVDLSSNYTAYKIEANTSSMLKYVKPWRTSVVSLMVLLAALVGADLVKYIQLNKKQNTLNDQLTSHFKEVFGNAPLIDPVKQFKMALKDKENEFYYLYEKTLDASASVGITLESMTVTKDQVHIKLNNTSSNKSADYVSYLKKLGFSVNEQSSLSLTAKLKVDVLK